MLISPNASQVAKVLRGGIAGIALSYAVKQLLGAVDWVLDPANNQIKYKDKPTVVCTDKLSCIPPSSQYYFTIRFAFARETISFFGKTPEEIHQSVFGYWRTVNTIYRWTTIGSCKVSGECEYYNVLYGSERVSTIQYFRVKNPAYDPNTQNQEKTLSLITVAQQVIENAENDNLDAQFAVLAAATNILSEAEQDDAKAKPIEDELENNSKCPSGIVRNGSCWICDKSLFMPYTRATRDAKNATRGKSCKNLTDTIVKASNAILFKTLINARVQENTCWSPPDPNHATALVDAQNALSLCEN